MQENVTVIKESGRSIVLVNDIAFKSRKQIDWDKIEEMLRKYVGECIEIIETADKIYIGKDFPDEFSHSNDTLATKGANEKAKANIVNAVMEIVRIATDRSSSEDYQNKHGDGAKEGWYRYTTRFGIPVYDSEGQIERYNIFSAKMLVRRDADGKLYLYDFVRTKKESVQPA